MRAKRTSSRELVQTSTRASNRNHVQVLGTRVIGAVDHGAHRETERHSELVSSSTSASLEITVPVHNVPRLAAAAILGILFVQKRFLIEMDPIWPTNPAYNGDYGYLGLPTNKAEYIVATPRT